MAREVLAGITTFLTMSYIVVVNPSILSTPGTGIPFSGALTATVLVCFTMTLLMGVYAKLPFGVAPGMGLNAFFAFTLIINGGIAWPVALGIIFWAGVLFLLVSATPLRERIAMAIPDTLRAATAAGIGLLLTFIGLQSSGFVAANPATLVGVGALDHRAMLTLAGLLDRRVAEPQQQSARVSRQHRRGDRGGLGRRLGDAAGELVQRAGLLVGVLQARHLGRAETVARAGDDHRDDDGPVRLVVDLHRRRAGRQPG